MLGCSGRPKYPPLESARRVMVQFENQHRRKSRNAFTTPNGMMTIKNAATTQLEEMKCRPQSNKTNASKKMRMVRGHCDLLRLMGFVMPAMLSRLCQPYKLFQRPHVISKSGFHCWRYA